MGAEGRATLPFFTMIFTVDASSSLDEAGAVITRVRGPSYTETSYEL
jgi:hypothetical protein